MEFKEAEGKDFVQIEQLIRKVWEPSYRHIVPQKQIIAMYDELCNQEALIRHTLDGAQYYLAVNKGEILGFVCLYQMIDGLRISKLYVDSDFQKKGVGRFLLDQAQLICEYNNLKYIELNVNRYNKALYFYRHYGFYIKCSEDIPYKEYWLNDYVMRLDINSKSPY
ncbi:MAG: GNAT family N-acetyltransferase [Chitinophagales bacterium]|nr:GNAT family N-acetyltransferase [Chitinophagales bacterium]MCZ2394741.1 GNAT family N-acetyltransferase [Chitinophagales bacterium]